MKAVVSKHGEISLPAELRMQDGIAPGQVFHIHRIGCGDYRLVLRRRPNEDVVKWLLACPEKGFFASVESESTR
jgi:hypothetical protein